MNTEMKSDFDPADAPYILCGLVALYKEAIKSGDDNPITGIVDGLCGEVGVMSELWELTIRTATALDEVIDFSNGELGVFAYEHLDRHDKDSLVWAVWQLIIEERGTDHETVVEVVRTFALAKGWPVNG